MPGTGGNCACCGRHSHGYAYSAYPRTAPPTEIVTFQQPGTGSRSVANDTATTPAVLVGWAFTTSARADVSSVLTAPSSRGVPSPPTSWMKLSPWKYVGD